MFRKVEGRTASNFRVNDMEIIYLYSTDTSANFSHIARRHNLEVRCIVTAVRITDVTYTLFWWRNYWNTAISVYVAVGTLSTILADMFISTGDPASFMKCIAESLSPKPVGWQWGNAWKLRAHSLTHSRSWALLEKLPIVQLLKNFPEFYGIRMFSTVFKRALHWSLS
jgi:hypothetical protein